MLAKSGGRLQSYLPILSQLGSKDPIDLKELGEWGSPNDEKIATAWGEAARLCRLAYAIEEERRAERNFNWADDSLAYYLQKAGDIHAALEQQSSLLSRIEQFFRTKDPSLAAHASCDRRVHMVELCIEAGEQERGLRELVRLKSIVGDLRNEDNDQADRIAQVLRTIKGLEESLRGMR